MTAPGELEDLLASTAALLFVADEGGRLFRWSEELARRVERALAPATPLAELVHPDDRGALAEAWARMTATRAPVEVNLRLQGGGRAPPRVCLEARPRPAGGAVHGIFREVGAAGLADLRRQEQLLRALLDNINVVVWSIDRDGIYTFQDGKGLSGSGIQPGQFLGTNIFEIYADSPETVAQMRRGLAGEAYHSITHFHGVDWENWAVPARDGDEVTGLLGLTLDISERKQAERELQAKIELIERQQEVIRTLSTPIIEVWDGVLALPMVGMLDSTRAARVMDDLLARVVATGARHVIVDLTGVDVVDSRVAGHLISLISAVQLLGAEGVITGIRPSVAQTMVSLELDLQRIVTHANLRAGLAHCIRQRRLGAAPQGS